MASLNELLKSEIARISRREIRKQVEPVKKTSAAYRRHIAALRRQVDTLGRQLVAQAKSGRKTPASAASESTAATPQRFVAKGLRALRARLELSAAEFGKLLNVSDQSIYNWENKKSVPQKAQVAALASLRGIGKREARARLDQVTTEAPKKRAKRAQLKTEAPKKRAKRAPKAQKKRAAGR
jgi:DNA-binding transcriptional regulator YiaG